MSNNVVHDLLVIGTQFVHPSNDVARYDDKVGGTDTFGTDDILFSGLAFNGGQTNTIFSDNISGFPLGVGEDLLFDTRVGANAWFDTTILNITITQLTSSTQPPAAPEPSTIALLGFGVVGVGLARRRRLPPL